MAMAFMIGVAILALIFSVTKIEFKDAYFVENYSIAWIIFGAFVIIILAKWFSETKFVDRKLNEYKNSGDRSGIIKKLNRLLIQSSGIFVAIGVAAFCYGFAFPNDREESGSSVDGSSGTHTLIVWMHENCYR